MSGEYVSRLKRRAEAFLREAKTVGEADLACFFAEQAMQLYIKAVCYEILGEKIRGHGLRELLGVLRETLDKSGFGDAAKLVEEFVRNNREGLADAEYAYAESRYGDVGFGSQDAQRLIALAESLIQVLGEVERVVKLG